MADECGLSTTSGYIYNSLALRGPARRPPKKSLGRKGEEEGDQGRIIGRGREEEGGEEIVESRILQYSMHRRTVCVVSGVSSDRITEFLFSRTFLGRLSCLGSSLGILEESVPLDRGRPSFRGVLERDGEQQVVAA